MINIIYAFNLSHIIKPPLKTILMVIIKKEINCGDEASELDERSYQQRY